VRPRRTVKKCARDRAMGWGGGGGVLVGGGGGGEEKVWSMETAQPSATCVCSALAEKMVQQEMKCSAGAPR